MRLCIAFAVGFLLVVSPLRGQTPKLTVEVDTTVVTVGDRVTLRVSVDHAAGDRVIWPDSLDLAPFEITGARALPPAAQGERARSAAVFSLVAFELGELEIPSFDVEVVDETGESSTLSTNPFGIRVVSVGLEEGGDIREIKGPLGIPVSVARILSPGSGGSHRSGGGPGVLSKDEGARAQHAGAGFRPSLPTAP